MSAHDPRDEVPAVVNPTPPAEVDDDDDPVQAELDYYREKLAEGPA